MIFDRNYNQNDNPDYSFERITDIGLRDIKKMGVRAIAIDLDDTAVFYGSYHLEDGVREWVDNMRNNGISIIVVSNTVPIRGLYLSHKLGDIPVIAPAFKPWTMGLRFAAKKLDIPVSEIAMIGDQLSTDILSANKIGAVSIKVIPLKQIETEKEIGISVPLATAK